MKQLKNIDLISINCVNPEMSVKALLYSSKDIEFGSIKLLAHYKPDNCPNYIEFHQIEQHTHDSINKFAIDELINYINNDYFISIHDDGFIINPHLWDDEWFEYDYIGAPWPLEAQWCPTNRVGNGGFVFKSRKFLELTSRLEWNGQHDDVMLTNTLYDYFTSNGCKYAPVDVAMNFSLESKIPECEYNLNNCFGFHGKGDAWIFKGEGQQFKDKIKLLETIK
jgi:hypothetical protein